MWSRSRVKSNRGGCCYLLAHKTDIDNSCLDKSHFDGPEVKTKRVYNLTSVMDKQKLDARFSSRCETCKRPSVLSFTSWTVTFVKHYISSIFLRCFKLQQLICPQFQYGFELAFISRKQLNWNSTQWICKTSQGISLKCWSNICSRTESCRKTLACLILGCLCEVES